MKKSIIFRVDGDFSNKYGSGHIWRCLKIYFLLKKNYKEKYNFVFLSKRNLGSSYIKSQTKEKVYYYKNNLTDFPINRSDIVIIDTLGAEKSFLKFLKAKNISKIISFDETNLSNYSNGIIINGILFTKKKLFSKKKQIKIYQGFDYLLLDKNFAKKKNIRTSSKKKTIVVCSGGNDKKQFSYKIVNSIKNFNNLKIKIIIGQGMLPSNLIYKFKKFKNIDFIENRKNLFYHFNSADISFVTGGTVMFESICCGTIPFVIKTYQNQKFAIKYLKDKKLINYLGSIEKINKKNLCKKLKLILNKKNFLHGKNPIDGKGIFRILKIIQELL